MAQSACSHETAASVGGRHVDGEPLEDARGSVSSGRAVVDRRPRNRRASSPTSGSRAPRMVSLFKADLLGIKENEVDIAVTGNRLTISGHIYDPRAGAFAGFMRAFTLPEGTDSDSQVRAELDSRLLTVRWSKRPEHAPEAASLPGDDALERWESEGGTSARQAERSRRRGPSRSRDDHAPQSRGAPPRPTPQARGLAHLRRAEPEGPAGRRLRRPRGSR